MAELYESMHTGVEIDDAVSRAKPGGEIDAILNVEEYSAEATYTLGDYCKHDGKLYRCTVAITEAEEWTADHWSDTSVIAELIAIYSGLNGKPDSSAVYTKTETDTLLQKKADSSSVYTKEESISAETRTALSLPETATPDAALAEIARQLSEKMTILWKNASPGSSFASQTITLLSNSHRHFLVVPTNGYPLLIRPGQTGRFTFVSGNQGGQSGTMTIMTRLITSSSQTSITFSDAKDGNGNWSVYNNNCIPHFVYGIDGIPV